MGSYKEPVSGNNLFDLESFWRNLEMPSLSSAYSQGPLHNEFDLAISCGHLPCAKSSRWLWLSLSDRGRDEHGRLGSLMACDGGAAGLGDSSASIKCHVRGILSFVTVACSSNDTIASLQNIHAICTRLSKLVRPPQAPPQWSSSRSKFSGTKLHRAGPRWRPDRIFTSSVASEVLSCGLKSRVI